MLIQTVPFRTMPHFGITLRTFPEDNKTHMQSRLLPRRHKGMTGQVYRGLSGPHEHAISKIFPCLSLGKQTQLTASLHRPITSATERGFRQQYRLSFASMNPCLSHQVLKSSHGEEQRLIPHPRYHRRTLFPNRFPFRTTML